MTILPTSITAARNLADALRDGRWDDVPRLNTVWQQADPIGHTLWHAAASAAAETGGEVPSPCEFCASCRERAADAERFVRANLATTTATAFWYRMQLASDRRRLTAAATPAERRRAAQWLAFAADTAALYLQLRDQYRTTEAIEAEADETARLHAALGYCWCGEQPCPMPSQHAATAQTC
ncbi:MULTISPECIES: hypothetical protein [unclassified Streptomyces]|uniref:hypothetical protein n=1 Tax=unclassified Streptomyces TaxID=2593676 RepID=UPI00225C3629|nr:MULTISPECIES: hypothetical protein [unclassified Streptomyces]MCX4405937.1 hypothetical protein [Streptomyces sp. NBC_01764]MCX5189539.1 hypothetical protein [Streptomyces sp. NBC_00268]